MERIPAEEWTIQPVESLALKYDTVENHGWYENLEPTIAQVLGYLEDGRIIVDYSGGTGILADRLLRRVADGRVGSGNVVSSLTVLPSADRPGSPTTGSTSR